MKRKAVLFDLDGTLLPMEQDEFTRGYFRLLAKKLAPRGYDPKQLVDAIWGGTAAMVANDGRESNENAFWRRFAELLGERVDRDRALFEEFYRVEFAGAKAFCGFAPEAREVVELCKAKGWTVALATNPIFPRVATEQRVRWAGLAPEDFALCTTYENIGLCKPNPAYFTEVARRLGAGPADCLTVGNDAEEDLAARDAGMQVFLLTDCLINRKGRDISDVPHGDFAAFRAFLETAD